MPEAVGEPSAEQEQPAERQHVGRDHPGERCGVEVELRAERGQGDVDDRGVEHDEELGEGEHGERPPAVGAARVLRGGGRGRWWS